MKRTLIALMEDKPGVLSRIAILLRRRNFNIASLTVGASESPGISRMTIVVDVDSKSGPIEQVVKQLYRVINVIKVTDVTDEPTVARELALIKVSAPSATRSEIMQVVSIYRAAVVDVALDSLTIEVTGPEDKIDSMIELLRPYGLKELVRTGRVSMVRGAARQAPPRGGGAGGSKS